MKATMKLEKGEWVFDGIFRVVPAHIVDAQKMYAFKDALQYVRKQFPSLDVYQITEAK